MSEIFGKNLRKARKAKGLTTIECAKHFDISQPAWNFYELGTREPKLDLLAKICRYLEVDSNTLLGIETDIKSIETTGELKRTSMSLDLDRLKETAAQLSAESAALSSTIKKLKAML